MLHLADGSIFVGSNIENASYGLTICGERCAIWNAVAHGYRTFTTLVCVTRDGGTSCGACRQVIAEFAPNATLYFCDTNGKIFYQVTVKDLLPHTFTFEPPTSKL